jgi:hypothetical protein
VIVIDNVVWTDSWPSTEGAGCSLICVGAGEELASEKGLCLAGPPRSRETSRLGLRHPVASGGKCGPHGGKKSKTKSWTGAGAG